ncbi:uncharacterized protein METZ01_LOCUS501567, partial [marine metagenome]
GSGRFLPGHRSHRGPDRAGQDPRREGLRLPDRRRHLLRHEPFPPLRRPRTPRSRGGGPLPDRRRLRKATRRRFRPLEVQSFRGRPAPAGVGLSLGRRFPRLAHRVLRDEQRVPRESIRHPHRRGGPHRGPPHQRDRPVRDRLRGPPLGLRLDAPRVPQLPDDTGLRSREDVQIVGIGPGPRRPGRGGLPPARLPVLLPPGPLPPAADVHPRGDARRRDGLEPPPAPPRRGRRR